MLSSLNGFNNEELERRGAVPAIRELASENGFCLPGSRLTSCPFLNSLGPFPGVTGCWHNGSGGSVTLLGSAMAASRNWEFPLSMLTLREPSFSPRCCLTALIVGDIPNLCAIDLGDLFPVNPPSLLDPGLPFAALLFQSQSRIRITVTAAIPPTVPPTMVPVDGCDPGPTGSCIDWPVGWLAAE